MVHELRRLGHDVLTRQDAGNAGQAISDDAVLSFAVTQGRAVLTQNRRHFIRLHASRPEHSGMVVCTVDPDFASQAQRVHEAIESLTSLHGQLVRVNRPG